MTEENTTRYTAPWIFGITNIPFGVAGAYTGIALPFLLRKAGLPIETIAVTVALTLIPAAYQLFWAPVIDLGIRRRSWLILCATLGSICLAASMLIKLPEHLFEYQVILIAGSALVGLVASCNGALVSTGVDPAKRGQAAGWVNAANLGAAVLGGGLVLTLNNMVSIQAAALALFLSTFLPSLAALAISEPPPMKEPILEHLGNMRRQVWQALKARRGWTGLLFCLSPCSTVALTNLFSGMGGDYHASSRIVEWVNGYGGGFITALGSLASGYILDRADRRMLFLLSGVLTAACAICMSLAPSTPTTYIIGITTYLLIAGLAYASFSAVVYEIVGTAGTSASTLYSVFPAAGNQAIAYTLLIEGRASHSFGLRGLLWTDAGMNIAGVLLLLLLMRLAFSDKTGVQSDDNVSRG
jgi:MFS transporter, PAT family, beta-lactamase induction signal transducer AmpG